MGPDSLLRDPLHLVKLYTATGPTLGWVPSETAGSRVNPRGANRAHGPPVSFARRQAAAPPQTLEGVTSSAPR